jgi:tripartite ATP-independent transporter DctP family solute receptor
MIGMTRRVFLRTTRAATGVFAFAILTRRGDAAEFTWRYANNLVATHPMNVHLQQAAERIRQDSGGRMEIQIFPNNQLGGDTDMLSQLRTGVTQLFNLSGLILATVVPVASINGIGFAFKDYDQVWAAMDGSLGAYVRSAIEKSGLFAFDKMWDNGYRQVSSSKHPINVPEDFKEFKIRVPVSPIWTSMFTRFGATPLSINFSEVYNALKTKFVDGQENPLSIVDRNKFYEVQTYISLTNHMWDGFWTLANGRAWAALPSVLQDIVANNINQAALEERQDIRKLNETLRDNLVQKGMIFNVTDPEKFRGTLRTTGFYAEWRDKYGPDAWSVFQRQVGALG